MTRMKTLYSTISAVLVAGACLFLSACASTGFVDPLAESRLNDAWKGRLLADAVGKWGTPIRVTADGNGATTYQWISGKDYVYDQYTGSDSRYTGEAAQYHSDGSITYSPIYKTTDYYEKRRGSRICSLLVHADASGRIASLQTQDYDGGCSEFYSNGSANPPDAESIARGIVFAEKIRAIKALMARYDATCTKPEYLSLFGKSPCDLSGMKIVGVRKESQMTPEQRAVLATWNAEMNAIIEDYLAFFRSNGDRGDKGVAEAVERARASSKTITANAFLASEIMASAYAKQLQQYAKNAYGKYLN